MSFCQPCREQWKQVVVQHPKATRWVAFFIGLSIFFTALGWVSDPVTAIGFCKVYP